MLLSDQVWEKVQVEGAVLAGMQETVPVGADEGAGAKVSVGVGKLPTPATVKVPATVTCCVASDFVTVS
jgi:hypothetical protein